MQKHTKIGKSTHVAMYYNFNFNSNELCFISFTLVNVSTTIFLKRNPDHWNYTGSTLTMRAAPRAPLWQIWDASTCSPYLVSPHILEHGYNLYIHSGHIFKNSGLASRVEISRKVYNILLIITGFRIVCPIVNPSIKQFSNIDIKAKICLE